MFPRRYFAGRYYAPRYFPQSAGTTPIVTNHNLLLLGVGQ